MSFRIDEVTVFTSIGADDEEGVVAFMGRRTWMPMVAADTKRLAVLRPMAQAIARETGRPVMERKFSRAKTVRTYEP